MSSARTLCRDMPIRYAAYGDSSIGQRILDMFRGTSTGFFIDIGAAHPWVNNNTWILEQNGWDGILVEPNVHFIELLEKHRKVTLAKVAIWSEDGEAAFNCGEMGSALVATGHKCAACFNAVMCVQTMTMRTFLETYQDIIPRKIEFISVDAQFAEHTFYRDLPLAKVISMEIHDNAYESEILDYFRKKGYSIEKFSVNDFLFVKMSIFERIKKWFKYRFAA